MYILLHKFFLIVCTVRLITIYYKIQYAHHNVLLNFHFRRVFPRHFPPLEQHCTLRTQRIFQRKNCNSTKNVRNSTFRIFVVVSLYATTRICRIFEHAICELHYIQNSVAKKRHMFCKTARDVNAIMQKH